MRDGVDFRELTQLTRDLKGWKPDKPLGKAISGAGKEIVQDARALVSPFSQSIPPTIKARRSKTTLTISAGGANKRAAARELFQAGYGTKAADKASRKIQSESRGSAIALLMERGNKGKSKRARTFRHPVFGNDQVWVEQPMHPYLEPAVEMNVSKIEAEIGDDVAESIAEAHRG